MKYITELDTDRIKKLAGKLPDNSALVKMDDYIFALNVSSGTWNTSQYGASLELTATKDADRQYSIRIDRNLVAKKLYEIAEPGGSDWSFLTDAHRARYIRMQNAGVKP